MRISSYSYLKTLLSPKARRKPCLIILAAFSLALGGCAKQQQDTVIPNIESYAVNPKGFVRANLYFLDGSESNPQPLIDPRELNIEKSTMPEKAAVTELLRNPGPEFGPVAGSDWTCHSVNIIKDVSGNIVAFIDIGIPDMSEIDKVKDLRTACMRTLENMSKVNYVYLTVDGKLPEVFSLFPLEGTNSKASDERKPFLIYYPDVSGSFAMPVVRMVSVTSQDYGEAIFREMKTISESSELGPNYPADVSLGEPVAPLPVNTEPVDAGDEQAPEATALPEVPPTEPPAERKIELPEGSSEVVVHLTGPESAVYEDRARTKMYNTCLGLSMLSIYPNIDTVRVCYHPYGRPEHSWQYTAKELYKKRGGLVPVYFSNKNNALTRVMRVCSLEAASDPTSSIYETIAGPRPEETDYAPVMPGAVADEDFLGYSIDRETLVISFSKEFYEKCSGLDEQQELYLVYSIVNALTENPSIQKVLFVRDGVNVQSIAGWIVLQQPLLRNPGIIR